MKKILRSTDSFLLFSVIFLCALLFMLPEKAFSSNSNEKYFYPNKFATMNGAYTVGIKISSPIIDREEEQKIYINVSGNGLINSSKLAFFAPNNLIDPDKEAKFCYNYEFGTLQNNYTIKSTSETVFIDGRFYDCLDNNDKEVPKKTEDIDFRSGRIRFETSNKPEESKPDVTVQEKIRTYFNKIFPPKKDELSQVAPIILSFYIDKDARPGPHSIQFIYTYFNGENWVSDSKNAEFIVTSFYEQHATLINVILFIIGILSIKDQIGNVKNRYIDFYRNQKIYIKIILFFILIILALWFFYLYLYQHKDFLWPFCLMVFIIILNIYHQIKIWCCERKPSTHC
ncbi:MAG: hypothetical protein C4518_05655 [Desulfobacteraceae bacterium]|nr:MAG: hypothetical protein C4518_05655 [Desulfobacteraceae bacterium]